MKNKNKLNWLNPDNMDSAMVGGVCFTLIGILILALAIINLI